MTPYEQVCEILHGSEYGWSVLETPAPEPVALALQTQTPAEVATTLQAYVYTQAGSMLPPYGAQESNATILRRCLFYATPKYWEYWTSIALGQQVELPVDTIGPAASPTEWWEHQERLRNRLGEGLCEAAEFARRNAFADVMPIEWRAPGMDPVIYQLAVREGYLPVGMRMFDPAYLQSMPRLKDVRGLDAMQWLENLQYADAGKPAKWLSGGVRNPAVK
ncbi:MAG: hypothetical protein Q8P41_31565 [Pseudomonadota bacterium]|nr:hypothetical protein [Pseudomonadota bacterium]